jgi:hypothetical protein
VKLFLKSGFAGTVFTNVTEGFFAQFYLISIHLLENSIYIQICRQGWLYLGTGPDTSGPGAGGGEPAQSLQWVGLCGGEL